MNQIAKQNPTEQLRQQLASMTPQFAMALPSHIKPEKFQRVVMTVAQQNPDLLQGDRRSLLGACMKCAADGLVPDGREAALVMFKGKPQYMPMMAGLLKRARNSGEISSVATHVVYEHDEFLIEYGDEEKLTHRPRLDGDRGKPIGAYAIAKLKDGSIVREWMSKSDIEKVRAVSRAGQSGPWVQWWDEMARKTVWRRLSKWLPMDAEDSEALTSMMSRDDTLGAPIGDADAAPIIDGEFTDVGSRLDQLEGQFENGSPEALAELAGERA
jgi:recombination protein RecT